MSLVLTRVLAKVVSWTCALLRLYTRFFIVRSPGCDDLFIVITLLFTSVGSITICLAVIYGGMGTHYITLEPDTMRTYLKVGCTQIVQFRDVLVVDAGTIY